jgi:sugar phosphate isomerase/epimerase
MHTQVGVFAKHISRTTPEELFNALAGFGFDCAQFNAACLGIPSLPDQIDCALWSRAARAAQTVGVRVVALSATFNLLDDNKLRLADNFRRLKVLAQGATILGTDLLTLCSGTRNQQDMWTYHPENQSSAAWQEMIDAMRRALEVAIEYDLNLGIEPEVANVVSNANDAVRLVTELNSNRIRIVFDPANLYRPPANPRRGRSCNYGCPCASGRPRSDRSLQRHCGSGGRGGRAPAWRKTIRPCCRRHRYTRLPALPFRAGETESHRCTPDPARLE